MGGIRDSLVASSCPSYAGPFFAGMDPRAHDEEAGRQKETFCVAYFGKNGKLLGKFYKNVSK